MDTLYRIDPFCRDERGRFVSKPDIPPQPLALLPAERLTRKRPPVSHWTVRRVRRANGDWSVLFVYIIVQG